MQLNKAKFKEFCDSIAYIAYRRYIDYVVVPYESFMRILRWIPFLWRIRDFDYGYSLQVYEFHLRDLEKCIANGYNVRAKEVAKRVKILRNLIIRMSDGNEYIDWDKVEIINGFLDKGHNPKTPSKIVYNVTLGEKDLHKYGEQQYQQDMELFCKIHKKYLRTFWD